MMTKKYIKTFYGLSPEHAHKLTENWIKGFNPKILEKEQAWHPLFPVFIVTIVYDSSISSVYAAMEREDLEDNSIWHIRIFQALFSVYLLTQVICNIIDIFNNGDENGQSIIQAHRHNTED